MCRSRDGRLEILRHLKLLHRERLSAGPEPFFPDHGEEGRLNRIESNKAACLEDTLERELDLRLG
jgi:hypothetical protein